MSYVVFSDVGGTVLVGTPWPYLRQHPQFDRGRANLEFAKFLPTYGLKKLGFVSETQMRQQWLAGMAATLRGMSRTQMVTMFRDVVSGALQSIMRRDVIEQLQAHKRNGAVVMLVSGIFADLVDVIAQDIDLDGAIGTRLAFDGEVVTGTLDGIPCVGTQKIEYIKIFMNQHHPDVALDACYGYADSYSDRALLSAVGHGVATYPDDQIRSLAVSEGWDIFPN